MAHSFIYVQDPPLTFLPCAFLEIHLSRRVLSVSFSLCSFYTIQNFPSLTCWTFLCILLHYCGAGAGIYCVLFSLQCQPASRPPHRKYSQCSNDIMLASEKGAFSAGHLSLA